MKKHLILCPVDYSPSSEPAIRVAADLAKVNKSKIVLLHVIDRGKGPVSMDDSKVNQIDDRIRNHYLAQNDIEFEHLTLRGDPSDVVVEYAKKNSADLIVMGAHGRTGMASMLAGSVAKGVMARASCPVVTVKLPTKNGTK